MLAFFRRIVNSRVGVVITFLVLVLIALAFALGDITGVGRGVGLAGGGVAKVGSASIGSADLKRGAEEQLDGARQQNPSLDMAQFVAAGGFEATLERLINELAMEQFGHKAGMVVGKRLVDGELASIPALQGPNGKFSQQLYESILAQRRLTDASVRTNISRNLIAQQMILNMLLGAGSPAASDGTARMPSYLALPYANLLLEKRAGHAAFVPAAATAAGPAPTDAEVQAWYKRNIARYSLPERRVVRYAIVTPASVQARATPTADEIRQAYQSNAAKYRPTEKRSITQVTVLDQTAANALAAKIKGGTGIAEAARAAGLEPRTISAIEKAGYATQASAAVADAVFAAQKGALVGPLRGAIGFIVARVDSIEQVPGKTLEQATPEIRATLTQQKTVQALADLQDVLGGAIDKDANFAELVADQKLQPQVTPALTANGQNPDDPAYRPAPVLAPIVGAGFAAAEGDAPTIVPAGNDGSFAVVALDRIVRAAPRPLATVRTQVATDFVADRALKAARKLAVAIMAKANAGAPLGDAVASAGIKLPAPEPLGAPRSALSANPQAVPPPLALLFSMKQGTAKLLPAPNGRGWYVIKLETVVAGDAGSRPEVLAAARRGIAQLLPREYAQEFTTAVRKDVGVKRNPEAIAAVKAGLLGRDTSDQ